ncbi:hypothetical protein ACF0H5_014617 [Mactra antiquata]
MENCGFCGLKNTEIMDMKMSEIVQRKKKTRRGKKSRPGKILSSGKSTDVFSTILNYGNLKQSKSYSKRRFVKQGVRPSSPKAPMNSTQFLIEDKLDRELEHCRHVDFQNIPSINNNYLPVFDARNIQSEEVNDFHRLSLSPKDKDSVENFDFYHDEVINKKVSEDLDYDYEPISLEDTVNFIEEDFEKVYNFHNVCDDNFKNEERLREVSKLPKFELINKIIDIENRLKSEETINSKSDDLKMKIAQLQEENLRLKSENSTLKDLLNH